MAIFNSYVKLPEGNHVGSSHKNQWFSTRKCWIMVVFNVNYCFNGFSMLKWWQQTNHKIQDTTDTTNKGPQVMNRPRTKLWFQGGYLIF